MRRGEGERQCNKLIQYNDLRTNGLFFRGEEGMGRKVEVRGGETKKGEVPLEYGNR